MENQKNQEAFPHAFTGWNDNDPRWVHLMRIVDEEVFTAMDAVAHKQAAVDHGTLAHAAGELCALLDVRERIQRERKNAQKTT